MKILIFAITLILSINVCAQTGFENTTIYVRVYDIDGKRIGKGTIISISDTLLQLKKYKNVVKIPVSSIDFIKTKRSAGHNVFIGAVAGATALAIIASGSAKSDGLFYLSSIFVTGGAFFGGLIGAAIGGISNLFKNTESFEINGDKVKLMAFKETMIEQLKNELENSELNMEDY